MGASAITVEPPIAPMLARNAGPEVPEGDFLYEPKWDGFRCLIFRLAERVVLQSRGLEDLSYAFPEVVAAAAELPPGTVLDGELAVIRDGRVDFAALSTRLRPRSETGGHIAALAAQSPAAFVGFDAVAEPGLDLRSASARQRRAHLSRLIAHMPDARLTPSTEDADTARAWLPRLLDAGLDGLIAKPAEDPYQPGVRALWKVKPEYTADVVVAGWRPHKNPAPDGSAQVGSLVLGLFDEDGNLHHVGSASSFSAAARGELTAVLDPLKIDVDEHPWLDPTSSGRLPDAQSRWRKGPATTVLVQPKVVAEVRYDGMIDGRFRHVARFLRWRPDRQAQSCGFAQLVPAPSGDVDAVWALPST